MSPSSVGATHARTKRCKNKAGPCADSDAWEAGADMHQPGDKSNKVNPPPDQSNVSHLTVSEPKLCDPAAGFIQLCATKLN
ncbi:hypothetical protein OJAV_G00220890 [Oryzias javanicus]|uniref:Uncharacterized protein n=1 Tax=Oryzias javanicus TaxID=123683 RepID=A0A3S2NPR6_ORYJA|nr:hypothetical protein OJAV_G00220890 [Oryzias javanicus]